MIFVYLSLAFVVGLITGIGWTMLRIREELRQADISSDDRRFIYDLLGIPE